MQDPVHALYQSRAYPAQSHPATDPAVTAVAAKLAGLNVPAPSGARILEIGCAGGHNLLPLAARWRNGRCTGIDFSSAAIAEARETARLAGLTNVEFVETDLRTFDRGAGISYDFIIAHGVYSWVPDDVRQALLDFCSARLSREGVALVSYNTLPGWSLRSTLVELTRLITTGPAAESTGQDPEPILGFLATAAGNHTPYARHLTAVLHDIFGKSGNLLPFDDFSPINEPCTFLDFTRRAGRSGLRYLGASQLAENFPSALAPEAAAILKPLANDPLALQQTIDVLTNRTFRSSLLCRADAPVRDRVTTATVLDFSIRSPHDYESLASGARLLNRAAAELARFDEPLAVALYFLLSKTKHESVPLREVAGELAAMMGDSFDPNQNLPSLARLVIDSARQSLVLLRDEPARFDAAAPAFPQVSPLRSLAALKGEPMVDIYHTPCHLDDAQRRMVLAMDGSRSLEELAALAKTLDPKLDFQVWIGHLAARGLFVQHQ